MPDAAKRSRRSRRGAGDLPTLLGALADDAVTLQHGFDRAWERERRAFERRLPALRDALGDAAVELAPRRLAVRSHLVSARVRIARTRRIGVSIGVALPAYRHDLLYARWTRSHARDSRIEVRIEQVPATDEARESKNG